MEKKTSYYRSISETDTPPNIRTLNFESNPTLTEISSTIDKLYDLKLYKMKNFCKLEAINEFAGDNANRILSVYDRTSSDMLMSKMVQALELKLADNVRYQNEKNSCEKLSRTDFAHDLQTKALTPSRSNNLFPWAGDEIWETLQAGIIKDKDDIIKASRVAGIEPRLLVATMFAEQSRMLRTQRGLYKKYLQPLKILASANQFSLGVMGVKPKTAETIENNLKNQESPFYLGSEYENLLDFSTTNPSTERYNRLSDPDHHYYSYLYGALAIRQLEVQWYGAGYPLENRPDVIATLYNIGFQHSEPNQDPQAGGAVIDINGTSYTYGSLSYEFYYSGLLSEEFPYEDELKSIKLK